jgi:hypothetical protein
MLESLHLQTGFQGQLERKAKNATDSQSDNEMEMYRQELLGSNKEVKEEWLQESIRESVKEW